MSYWVVVFKYPKRGQGGSYAIAYFNENEKWKAQDFARRKRVQLNDLYKYQKPLKPKVLVQKVATNPSGVTI